MNLQRTPAGRLFYLKSAFTTHRSPLCRSADACAWKRGKMSDQLEFPKNIYLIVDQQMVSLNKRLIKIGRHPDNDIIIVEPRISRFHAEIRYEDDKFIIYDMHSKVGTFANGKRVENHVIQSGDTILLANLPMLVIDRSNTAFRKVEDETDTLEDQEE